MSELQHFNVLLQGTDHLNTRRHAGRAKTSWHTERRQSGHGGRDDRLHPAVVGVHLLSRDFFGPVQLGIKGEDLRGGHDEEVIRFKHTA